jgi:hypothetical protein
MISMKMALSKIGEGGGDEAESRMYGFFWGGTWITTYLKKNHQELFLHIFQS